MDPAFIQQSWIFLAFSWTCLVAEEWERISPFPYIPCERDCEIPLWFFFFPYCLSQRPAAKNITRVQRRKFMPWVISLNQIHTVLTHLTLNLLIISTARFVYLVGPQLCNSLSHRWGFHTATDSHRSEDWKGWFQVNQHYPLTCVTKVCAIPLQFLASLYHINFNLAVWYSSWRKKHAK